ncbi:ABC transporter permease [Taylorella equigenitalis]|uniref:ABC lipoprotein transporter n=1 Tax=Taylorella equigenitalis ATCC 35865 TaxID=743973 RepID=A0ABM5NBG9_9BURK|nr:FtsX-like permease family protein [Taylorella equigenitalis]AFN36241.1 putative ABC lipoprotein transporter [Taylorella equigenitalis ATCC 35865]ASY39640.1 peptide ABC transporter permease [Taylorella equigenitalis]VEG32045.1 FtsX-like permease family [Taylorella equigenitalis ATCC 35865]
MKLGLLILLVFKDLRHDWKVSFFVISALVAVIAPLLLLFSLKYGIVSQLQNQLLNDPNNLEIKIHGVKSNVSIDKNWLDSMQKDRRVKFVIPMTRSLNMQANLRKDNKHFYNDVELIPSRIGDPLMPRGIMIKSPTDLIINEIIAQKLDVKLGDSVTLFFGRNFEGKNEISKIDMKVVGILKESYLTRPAAFVSLELLETIEDYRDGYKITKFVDKPSEGRDRTKPRERYAKARIYANSLDDVAPLAADLRNQGIDSRTKADSIESVKSIDRVLNTVFLIIALTTIVGTILSLFGSFLANIDRKRKDISLMSLYGFNRLGIRFFIVLQAVILSSIAYISSYFLYILSSNIMNSVLGKNLEDSNFVSLLKPEHVVIGYIATLAISVFVALIGAQRAVGIQPSESLREA